ncbi:hypothetical protein NPIL_360511, partial [Nephila pilipes]
MAEKMSGKKLLAAVREIDSGEFLEMAALHKSKEPFNFQQLLKTLEVAEIRQMWEDLKNNVQKRIETLLQHNIKEKRKEPTVKK